MKRILLILLLFGSIPSMFGQGVGDLVDHHWKLDETSGTNINDEVGTLDGTVTGATINQTGKLGKAVLFDATGEYILCADDIDLQMESGDFTWTGWVYPNSFGSSWRMIVGGETNAFTFGTYGASGYLNIAKNGTAGTNQTTLALTQGAWNFVAIVYDGTASTNNLFMYVNSTTYTMTFATGGAGYDFDADASSYRFGSLSSSANNWDGLLDEISVFKGTKLTEAQLDSMYNSGNAWEYPFAEEEPPPAGTSNPPVFRLLFDNNGTDVSGNKFNYHFDDDDSLFSVTTVLQGSHSLAGKYEGSVWESADPYTFDDYLFSISANFYMTSATGYTHAIFTNKSNTGSVGFDVSVDKPNARIQIRTRNLSTTEFAYTSNNTVTWNTWHHVVAIFRMGSVSVYLDNTKMTMPDSTIHSDWTNTTDTIAVGGCTDGKSGYFESGYLDNIQFYDYDLNTSQVDSLYINRASSIFQLGGAGGSGTPYNPSVIGSKKGSDKKPYKNLVLKYFFKAGPGGVPVYTMGYGYDSTKVLAIRQDAYIPEAVLNNDDVHYWLKNRTWRSGNTINYAIEDDPLDAFSLTRINNDSARVWISNYTKINGKRISHDTVAYLKIRTTDVGLNVYEIDTLAVHISEASYDHFIDYSYSGTESTEGLNRSQPRNDLDDLDSLKIMNKYWFARGKGAFYETTSIQSKRSTEAQPMVFGAYGQGKPPEFNGGAAAAICWYIGYDYLQNQCKWIIFNNLKIRNYGMDAILSNQPSYGIKVWSCIFNNDYRSDAAESVITYSTELHDDTLAYPQSYHPIWIQNCSFDTTSFDAVTEPGTGWEKSYLKIGAGPLYLYNSYFGPMTHPSLGGNTIRHMGCHGSIIKHNIFNGADTRGSEWCSQIQLRAQRVLVYDNVFLRGSNGINLIASTDIWNGTPDELTIMNNLFRGIIVNAINYIPASSLYKKSNNNAFDNNYFDRCRTALSLRKVTDSYIRRNIMRGGSGYGIFGNATEGLTNIQISYNVMYGYTGSEITIPVGSNIDVYQNTIDGDIDIASTTSPEVRGTIYGSTDVNTGNNLRIADMIPISNYFMNYSGHDYRLKSMAIDAIDKGPSLGLTPDIIGTTVPQNSVPDIGAYEYVP